MQGWSVRAHPVSPSWSINRSRKEEMTSTVYHFFVFFVFSSVCCRIHIQVCFSWCDKRDVLSSACDVTHCAHLQPRMPKTTSGCAFKHTDVKEGARRGHRSGRHPSRARPLSTGRPGPSSPLTSAPFTPFLFWLFKPPQFCTFFMLFLKEGFLNNNRTMFSSLDPFRSKVKNNVFSYEQSAEGQIQSGQAAVELLAFSWRSIMPPAHWNALGVPLCDEHFHLLNFSSHFQKLQAASC